MVLPLLEALNTWRPELHLDILVEAPFASVFSRHPAVHETLILKPGAGSRGEGWTRPRALAEIRRRKYRVALNLHGGTTSLLLTLASGAGIRIGQETYRNAWAYNVHLPHSSAVWNRKDLHTVEHQLTLLRWVGIPVPTEARATLYVDAQARYVIRKRLRDRGIDDVPYFLIHPTATLFTKQWEEKNFAALADQLVDHYGLPVVFTAASHEAQTLARIRRGASRNHIYWSDLRLDELFALIDSCRLFIGNDSGPTHAASALNKPIVVVWGSSNFIAWRPWGADYELIRSDLPCMPCPGFSCAAFGAPKCILDIHVDRVLQACKRILGRTEGPPCRRA